MDGYVAEIRRVTGSPGANGTRLVVSTPPRSGDAEMHIEKLSGGHLLHLALAGCAYGAAHVLATRRGVTLRDCRITVEGGFEDEPPRSTGIAYDIELTAAAPADELEAIAREVDVESFIPNFLRATTDVVLRNIEVRTLADT